MKKINKLLIGLTAISSAVIPVAAISSCSCNNGGYDITPTGDAKVKSQEVDSNGNLVITLEPTKSSESITGVEQVKIGDKTLTENTDYTFSNGKLTIKKAALEANKGKITFKVKTGSEEEMTQEKWENIFNEIDSIYNPNSNFTVSYNSSSTKRYEIKFDDGKVVQTLTTETTSNSVTTKYFQYISGQILTLDDIGSGKYTYGAPNETPLLIWNSMIALIRTCTSHTYKSSTKKYEGQFTHPVYLITISFSAEIKDGHVASLYIDTGEGSVTLNFTNVRTTTIGQGEFPTDDKIVNNVVVATPGEDTWTANIGSWDGSEKICIFNVQDKVKTVNKLQITDIKANEQNVNIYQNAQIIASHIQWDTGYTTATIDKSAIDAKLPICCSISNDTTISKTGVKLVFTTSD